MNTNQLKRVAKLVYGNMCGLYEKDVQVQYIVNREAVTVELSRYSSGLRTLSVIIFENDYDRKLNFLHDAIHSLMKGNTDEALETAVADYKRNFSF